MRFAGCKTSSSPGDAEAYTMQAMQARHSLAHSYRLLGNGFVPRY